MMKTYTNFNVSPIKLVEKGKIFTLLLVIMGTLIPAVTNAKQLIKIEVLTIEKKIGLDKDFGFMDKICDDWKLSNADVKDFCKTAKPLNNYGEMNFFDIYNCEMEDELLFNGVKKKYSINIGGSAILYGYGSEQQGFGCKYENSR